MNVLLKSVFLEGLTSFVVEDDEVVNKFFLFCVFFIFIMEDFGWFGS